MNAKNYWRVEMVHASRGYNDSNDYAILNGQDETQVRSSDRRVLDIICHKHNLCFLDEDK